MILFATALTVLGVGFVLWVVGFILYVVLVPGPERLTKKWERE